MMASPHSTKVVHMPATGLSFPLKADYERVNQSLFDLSVVDGDVDAISMAHPFEGPGRGLTVMPQSLPIPVAEAPPPVEEEQPPAPIIVLEAPLEEGEGPVVDEMSTTVPDPVVPVLDEAMEENFAAGSGAPEETQ